MHKARLIKREELVERQQGNAAKKTHKKTVKNTIKVVSGWIDRHRTQQADPRAAFAALFAQPEVR